MTIYNIYDEIAELYAQLNTPKVMALSATKKMQDRFEILIEKFKNSYLDIAKKYELDHFIVLECLIRLAKIRAINLV